MFWHSTRVDCTCVLGSGPAYTARKNAHQRTFLPNPQGKNLNPMNPLVLLRHKMRRFVCLIGRVQQGHRERPRVSATISRRRIVAIEFGM